MKLSIKNLGFIKSGEFETNNLTIIFGKNNSGKTYLSHTAYILSKETKKLFSMFAKKELDIKKLLDEGSGSTVININEIIDTNSYTTLNIVNNSGLSQHFALHPKYFSKTEIQFDFYSLYKKAIKSSFEIIIESHISSEELLVRKEISISRITGRFKKTNIDKIVENKLSSYSMPIADNIRILRNQHDLRKRTSNLSTKKSYFDLRKSLRKITKGTFKVDLSGDVSYLMDEGTTTNEIPFHVASSSIKSMVLMDLYINHIANVDDTLIIDEPELNLHPDNQTIMAELIVRLVNIGVNVIMTTHSDYIVREINNRIRLHAAPKESSLYKSLVDSNLDAIDHKKVSIYNITDEGIIEKGIVTKMGMENIIFDDAIIESSEREELIISLLGD